MDNGDLKLKQLHSAVTSDLSKENFIADSRPKIIYVSRTHSQLSQVVKEFLNTPYKDSLKMCVLGSREQMCLESSVKAIQSSAVQTVKCRQLVSTFRCSSYNNMGKIKHITKYKTMDIEDLVQFGKAHHACPYYLSRESQNDADIIFMPYNYLVDPNARKAQNIAVENSILIFDEAHNLESFCADAASFDLSILDIAGAVDEIDRCRAVAERPENRDLVDEEELKMLKVIMLKIEDEIQNIPLPASGECTKPGSYIFDFFNALQISHEQAKMIIGFAERVTTVLSTLSGFNSKSHISSIVGALKTVFMSDSTDAMEDFSNSYRIFIKKDMSPNTRFVKNKENRILSFWCFNSSVTMNSLVAQECRSIILTSGTLSPLASFACEMGIKFSHQLENPHVIKNDQIFVGIVPVGPGNVPLNSSYKNRDSAVYYTDLGNALVNYARIVPDGMLLFFPSYGMMDLCVKAWKASSDSKSKPIWDRLSEHKKLFLEPRDKGGFSTSIEEFYEMINNDTTGAIFMAVCRGKASEGIDFSDTRSRAVIITGIPFPSVQDARVKLKREYLDEKIRKGNSDPSNLSGENWYRQQAARAVNQAIGRVIRHRNDWGAVLLCDERFGSAANIDNLPYWIKPYVNKFDSFGKSQSSLSQFLKHRLRVQEMETKILADSKPLEVPELNGKKENVLKHHTNSLKSIQFAQKTIINPSLTKLTSKPGLSQQQPVIQTNDIVTAPKNLQPLKSLSKDSLRGNVTKKQKTEAVVPVAASNTVKREESVEAKANVLLKEVKDTFGKSDYKTFQKVWSNYKNKVIPFTEFLNEMEVLFGTPERFPLLKQVASYVPSKYRPAFHERIETIEKRVSDSILKKSRPAENETITDSKDEKSEKRTTSSTK
ncbi:hypothetical protein MP638_004053 [Amoeboaphelidium occidentale]|nr:hypothetical protein MP638_004053 [Amoeboaphelidium occidentale]